MSRKTLETIGWIIIGANILFLAMLPALIVILHDLNNAAK